MGSHGTFAPTQNFTGVVRLMFCQLGYLPRKKTFFCPKNNESGCILTLFLTAMQKTRSVTRSLATRILRFNRETKLTKTVQKLLKNIRSQTKGAVAPFPPEYATGPK